ncbi:hypothetical protein U8V72_17480 [Priestia filamentosa]|uniref:hypothetical protein n=1 Tax=Priestia filamentosa TaxID=1402861 RepID=UPI000AC15F30
MQIQIISAYDEIAWYSKLVGKTFEVIKKDDNGDVKVKWKNDGYSYWVGVQDYKVVSKH